MAVARATVASVVEASATQLPLRFPLKLSGKAIVVKQDWCRGCSKGEDWHRIVDTVRAPGSKGRPHCEDCWEVHIRANVNVFKRGELPSYYDQVEQKKKEDVANYPLCFNGPCKDKWRKARWNGYCSYTCACECGFEETLEKVDDQKKQEYVTDYPLCINGPCKDKWRKARWNGYCSYTCACECGFEEELEKVDDQKKMKGVMIAPPGIAPPVKEIEENVTMQKYKALRPEAKSQWNSLCQRWKDIENPESLLRQTDANSRKRRRLDNFVMKAMTFVGEDENWDDKLTNGELQAYFSKMVVTTD